MLGGRSAQGEPVPSKPWMGMLPKSPFVLTAVVVMDPCSRPRLSQTACMYNTLTPVCVALRLSELRASLRESVCLPGSNEQVRAPQGWHYRDNDFFQELWMQLAASGTGQFCERSNGLSTFAATVA